MKVCFIGDSRSYKTIIAYYIWSNVLGHHKPTIGYQMLSYRNHVIYDCSCDRYNISMRPLYEDMDFFFVFAETKAEVHRILDSEQIKIRNKKARICGVMSPCGLEECAMLAEEIKKIIMINMY